VDNKEIGQRIKLFRSLYNKGKPLSSAQLAHRLDEGPDKIRNYESGRSALPLRLLLKFHNQGLSMHYLLTGEGEMFSDTPEGLRLMSELEEAGVDIPGRVIAAAAADINEFKKQ